MAEHFNGAAAWAERKKERAASFDGAAAWSARREQRRAALAAAPQPLTTRETERADELDKLTRPSARRTERADEADKQTPPRRTLETPAGSALVRNTDSGALQQRMVQQLEEAAKNGLFQRAMPEERGSRHRSGKELSQKILHDTETAERIRNAAAGTAQGAAANAAGFLGALVAAAEKIDKQYRDEKERLGATTHADEMNPYPRTNEEVTRGNRAGVQLLEGIADTQRAKAQANTARAKEGASALGSIGIDALQIGLNLAAIVGANAVAPGAGLALMGTQSGGAAANDYRQRSIRTDEDAIAYLNEQERFKEVFSLGKYNARTEPWTREEIDAVKKEYAYNPLAAAGLALGGLASAGIGSAAAKGALKYGGALVNRLGLGNSAIAQYALGALGDLAFSGGMSAANEYAKAAAYGDSYKEVRISGEDLAKDMLFQAAVGFLCRTLAAPFGGKTSSAGQPERVQREYFKGIDNLDDLAKAFKQYGRQYHPDRFATADAATQRQMSDIFARISAEYNAVKAELAIETAGRAAKSYSEKRGAKTPEAAEQAGRAVENELMILKRAVENGMLAGAEAAEAVQIMEAAQGSAADSPAAGAEDALQAQKSSPAQDAGYSRQRAGGPVAPSGVSATQESKTSIAPAAAEGNSGPQEKNITTGGTNDAGQEVSYDARRAEPAEGGAGDDLSDRGGRRDAGARAGEPAGGVESSRPQRAAEQSGAAIERQNLARDLRLQKVSSAELGVRTGTDTQSVTVLPEERWDAELRDAAERIQRETGKKTTMVLGAIPVRTKGGVQRVRGVWASEGIIIQADNLNVSASQIASHEIFHEYADQNPGLIQAVERSIREKYGSEEFDRVLDAYIRKLRGIIDIPENAADYEAEQALLDIKNEIFADAYADINAFGQRAGKYRAEVRQTLEGRGIIDIGSEAEAATARRTGPPERYSIRRTQDIPYQEQIDAFYGGDSKIVGRSDDIYIADADNSLSALGIGGKPFFMLKRNLQKITRKEGTNKNYSAHGIGEDIIRDLPDMLKDPAIVIVGDGRISVIPGRTVDTAREKAAPLLIGINPNGSVDGASAYEIKTMYGREGFADWLGLRAGDSKIIAGNENKAAALLRNVGIKITEPVAYAADLTDAILSQRKSDVKFPTLGEEIRRQIQGDETAAPSQEDRGRTGPPVRYSYAGKSAKSADLAALDDAQHYEMQGVDAETIRHKTGWFRGMDGKWRSEVNDSGMKLRFESALYDYDTELREKNRAWDRLTDRKLTDGQRRDLADYQRSTERGETDEALYEKLTGEFGGDFEKWALTLETMKEAAKSIPNYTTLGKLVDAPELFAAYPDLADVGVTFQTLERGQNGGYHRRFDSIELSRDLKNRPEALLDSLTHEVQHAIQSREGFTPGANPQYWNRKLEEGYDGRTAKARREGAQLRKQYEQMKADDPEFMRSMEALNAMAPTVPRGKIDPNTWEQVEPDPPEWVRFDERRDQLEEKYGDRVWDYFSLRDSIDRNARDSRMPYDLYRDTAGEIEARDAAARRGLTAEERRGRKPNIGDKNTVFADGGESYSLNEFADGKRFVDVQTEQSQFDGLDDKQKTKRAIQVIKEKFAGKVIGIDNRVFVNGRSAAEYGHPSKNISSDIRDAKMRASTELDNLIDAGTNFRTAPDGKDGHVHPNAVGDFQYFDTTFKVGNEYYKGTVNIEPVSKGLLLKDITKIENITQDISSSYGQNPKSTFLRDASMDSIRTDGGNVKRYSLDEQRAEDEAYLSFAEDPKRNRGKLQEMVNAAAERAGYDSPDLYHGTRAFGFTEFDLAKMDDGTSIFLTTNPTVAGTYTSVDAENTNLETLYRNPKSPADRGNPLKRVDAKSAPLGEVIAAWNREADALGAHKYRASSHEDVLARAGQKIGEEAPRMAAAAKRYAEETDGLSTPMRQYLKRLSELGNYSGRRLYEEISILKATESGFEQGSRPDSEMNAFVERTGGIPTETAALAQAALSDGAFVEYIPNGKNVRSGHPIRATEAKFREFYQRQAERENGIYKVRARLQNPLVIDAQGAAWSDVGVYAKELALEKNANLKQLAAELGLTVEDSGSFLSKKRSLRGPTRSWSQYAKSHEYDGVIFKNLYDPGMDVENDANGVSDVYIVFDPAQVKSTEAVTYDDSGRAIPLSERFDAGERDIRYSADDEGDGEWDEIPTLGEEIRRQIMGEEAKGGSIAKKRGNIKPRTFWEEVRHQIQGEEPDKQRYSAENDEFYERLDEELADRAAEEDRKAAREKGIAAYSKPLIAKKELQKAVLDIFSVPVEDRDALRTTIDQYADSVIKRGKLTNRERSEFFNKMYGSGIVRMEADKVSKAAGQYVAHRKIYVPSEAKAQFGDSWNSFRKRAYAAGIYLTNDQSAIGVEAINAELSEQLPTLFDPRETSERQTLERIVQLAEEGQAERVSLSEYIAQVAGKNAGYADRILNGLEQKMDQALQTFAEKAGLETELRSRSLRRELAEHDRRIEMAQKKRENRELREMQQKTLKQLQWLSKNRSRAPEAKRAAWDEVLGDIDIYAASAANEMHWSKKHEATWGDLRDMYLEAKNGAEHGDPKYANFMPSKELQHIVDRLDKDKLADMDIDALKDLYKAAVGLRTEFYNRNKVLNDEHDRVFEEIYTDAGQEIRNAPKGKKRGGAAGELFDELINGQQLSPMNIIQRMGGWNPDGALYSMAKQLETGERNVRDYTVKANRLLEDFLNQHQDWAKKADGQGEDAIWYELEVPELIELGKGDKPIFGDTVKVYMTPAQKVHLYLESKNYDNLLHMTGGRTFVNRELYSKGKRSEALEQGTTVKLAPESVKKLVSSLTPEEAELARILERYYNDFAPKAINRVSNVLLGYDKAVTKNYAPIYTNRNYTKSEFGVFDMSAEGVGNLKERKRSTTPSYNLSAFDAFEKHVEQTARYTGMAIPTRNMNTLLDWRGKDDSMRDVIAHEWGGRANKYIEDLVTEMQGEKNEKSTVAEIIPERVFSNYISAVFGFNPSIVLKQLGSIPMGSAYLGAKNFPSPKKIRSIDKKLISKYTQELAWRTMGYSMPETKQLKDNPNWTETNKTVNTIFGGGAITAMDGWAASILWPQAENKVRREHPELEIGTKEQIDSGESPFYQEVAREFNDAVARSQSTSDIIHQSTLRRSRNPIARAFTLFKSDSAQTYNAIRQKYGEWQYYKRSGAGEETLKKARRGLGEAVLAALVNAVWSGTVTFLVAAVKNGAKRYRDDDDELTAESVFKEFGMGLVGDLAGIMAGGEELADIIGNGITGERWYRIEAPGLEQMDDLLEGAIERVSSFFEHAGELNNIIENKGDVGEYLRREGRDIAGWIREVAKDAATYLPGVPTNNIEAYLLGAVRSLSPELAAAYEDAFMRVEKSDLSHLHGRTLTAKVRDLLKDRTGRDSKEAAGIVAGLYDDGYTDAVPTATPSKVTIDKKDRELNAYQTQVYEKAWRKAVGGELDRLVTLNAFRSADDETQEKMLRRLYTYAGEMAKAAVFDDYEPKKFAGEYADAAKKGRSVAALIADELE